MTAGGAESNLGGHAPERTETSAPAATGSTKKAPAERAAPSAPKVSVAVLRTAEELEPFIARWEQLAKRALEPNAFLEPWLFLPGLRAFGAGKAFEMVAVSRRDGSLIGLFPFTRERKHHGVPVPTLASWRHDFHFVSTPLVHADHARECMDALFEWLARDSGATLVELAEIMGDGPFQHVLLKVLADRAELSCSDRWTRGLYLPQKDADTYLASILDSEGRRRLRSKEKHLGAEGRVEYAELQPDGDVAAWTAEFLTLEASGWKGARGTAMASEPDRKRYFEQVIAEAFARKQLEMTALRVNGRAVAMKCNFRAGDGAFVFKIAYDESLGKSSPGMLLEVDNIRRLHAGGAAGPKWMDSCAHTNSRLFGDSCNRRHTIETILIAPGGEAGKLVVALFPLARWAARQVRALRNRTAPPASAEPARPLPPRRPEDAARRGRLSDWG